MVLFSGEKNDFLLCNICKSVIPTETNNMKNGTVSVLSVKSTVCYGNIKK